eukprot:CAMPEP_0182570878 /NCGR_PEP_ID=MMETSP1324-20130603/11057_1 /TAXON_ID=236786 /ORGANISM="Florenciella sp., Strain RCC1587" /LENGTH=593 /DNA_ID=CAMNT_0024785317 /DNA_START=79 /DNA_END=1860 /DNA_ORIENTATION=+
MATLSDAGTMGVTVKPGSYSESEVVALMKQLLNMAGVSANITAGEGSGEGIQVDVGDGKGAEVASILPTSRAEAFRREMVPKLLNYVETQKDTALPVIKFRGPEELEEAFDAVVADGLKIGSAAVDSPSLLAAVDTVLEYGVRTGSPLFNNQLFGTPDAVAMAGDWLTSAMNASAYTYEVAPVFALMETELLVKIGATLGGEYAKASNVEGLFVPGGSISNLYAVQVARYRSCPKIKEQGNSASPAPLCAFVSDQIHYSFKKACSLLGLGSDCLIVVPTDPVTGAMDSSEFRRLLEESVAAGKKPFFVGTSAGTTVLGAFDPYNEIADICDEYNEKVAPGGVYDEQEGHPGIWMHVDGAWGGSAFLSAKYKYYMAGAERANSYSWNPHKMMGATLQTCAFVTRHAGMLLNANGTNAAYLFQPDKEYRDLDYGDKTIQCGRKVDHLKLWLMWKYHGDVGMEARVDHLCGLAEYMSEQISTRVDEQGRRMFVQVAPTSFTNVVFYTIPPSLRLPADVDNSDAAILAALDMDALKTVAPMVKKRMQEQGLAMIGFQQVKQWNNCWRMVFAGAKEEIMTTDTVDEIMNSLLEIGSDL